MDTGKIEKKNPGFLYNIKILFTASRGYLMVNVANFGDGVAYFGFLALMVLFLKETVGFSSHLSTVSVSIFSGAVTIFMALGAGALADRLGVRRALTVVWILLVLGRVIFIYSPAGNSLLVSGIIAFLGIFFMAAGEGVIQPALNAGVKHYTDERTKTLGYAFIYAIMNLGIIVGELLSPFIREFWAVNVEKLDIKQMPTAGITGSFWFFTLVTLLMLTLHLMFFTKKVENRDCRISDAEKKKEPKTSFMSKIMNLPILDARFLYFIFILLPVRTLFAHQFLTMPLFVQRAFPAAVAAKWEWIYVINPAIIVLFVPLIAALTLKRKVLDMMIIGTTLTALCSFLLCTEPNLYLLLAYMVFFSFGEAMWSSRFLEYVADMAPAAQVGIYMGIAAIPWFCAKMATGFFAGKMLDIFVPETGAQSPQMLWLIYGLVALITPLGLLSARKWLLKGIQNKSTASAA